MTYDHRAAAGVTDANLAALLEDSWEAMLRRWPTWASRLGDRRFDDRLPGTTPGDHDSRRADIEGRLARAGAIDRAALDEADRLTLDLFLHDLETDRDLDACRLEEWTVDARSNPVTTLGWLPEIRPVGTTADADALVARYEAFGASVDGAVETLRIGVADGRFANAESVRRTIDMARREIGKPTAEWAATTAIDAPRDVEAAGLRERVTDVLERVARSALARYADFLEREILPHGREGDDVGLTGIPGGDVAYAAAIRRHTTLALPADEIHRTGLEALEGIHEEFAALGKWALGTSSVPEVFGRLRTDPELRFGSAEEVEEAAERALATAREAIPRWFGRLPQAECVVKPIPEHEAPYTTIAYYRPAPADGSGPGEYRVNTHAPETRPRHEAEVLAFHESIPGHHLQIAIAQELPEMPAFRRHAHFTSYIEGWALYTERLADEMGLYSGETDRLGMLSFDAWRAARLVVDTGIHAMGWSRERAARFMVENTPLAENNVDNEVDRYIVWPGQALSYKIGQIEMWRIRREAEARQGDAFDIREFHDAVLEAGALPLPILRSRLSN